MTFAVSSKTRGTKNLEVWIQPNSSLELLNPRSNADVERPKNRRMFETEFESKNEDGCVSSA